MGYNFTGTDVWVATLTGPANTEDLTAESVTDAMVQQSNRTTFLGARMHTSYMQRHIQRTEVLDAASAYADDSSTNTIIFEPLATYYESSLAIGSIDGLIYLEFHGTVQNTSATDFAEVRLEVDGDDGPHVYVPASTIMSVSMAWVSPDPSAGSDKSTPVSDVGLYGRMDAATGVIKTIGGGVMDFWLLTKVDVS